ncbi:MAG TPA: hypothetical protein PKW62_03720 [Chitinophagaceae bacterium]|nr:hypothetical protein [Chitinophagaceae bacterium]
MARSHHRKKHKSHVQQFKKERSHSTASVKKGKTFQTFTIVGALVFGAIGFFATNSNLIAIIIGLIVGGVGGYFLGKSVDAAAQKKQ